MTGFAPISNAPAVGANSVLGASSGAQSAAAQGPSDFSSVLHATANVPQTASAAASDKSGVAAQPNSGRAPKASAAQSNSQTAVAQARSNAPVATAAPPVPPPVPPATVASLDRWQAESESAAAIAAQPANPADAAANKIASAATQAATNGTNDSILAQSDATKNDLLDGSVNATGDLSASQSTASADQSTALAAEAEIAASISTALGAAAAGDRSQVGPAQTDSAKASSAPHDSAASNATPATTSSAKPAATPELTLKFEPLQTVLPAQIPAAPKASAVQEVASAGSASARSGPSGRPITQAAAAEAVPANGTAANASLQKAISDARDKLVQAIDTNLQAEISAAPAKAISSANPANGEPGNRAGQNPANPSFNSSAQDLLQQYSDSATGVSTNASGNSSDLEALGAITSASAVEKAAALVAAATDPTLHVLPDASQQAPSFATTPTPPPPAISTTSASAAPPPPSPLPQTLPQSLSDLAKASEMYQRAGGSEMHVAMETDLLGAVDLRATMHQGTLTATIGVQRADIQALLSNELPALQHALADKNLHVDQISVLNNSVGGRAGSGGQQEAPAQNRFAPRGGYPPIVAGAAASNAEVGAPVSMGAPSMAHLRSDDSRRISVHV
jgi:Flagellar hook-length control protein FliK